VTVAFSFIAAHGVTAGERPLDVLRGHIRFAARRQAEEAPLLTDA